MSDEHPETAGDERAAADEPMTDPAPRATASGRSPRPGASAASRARRIGGRPTARPVPGNAPEGTDAGDPVATGATGATGATATVGTDEAGRRPRLRKSRPAPTTAAPADPAEPGESVEGTRRAEPIALPGWLRWAPAAILAAGVIAMAVVVFVVSNGVWRNKPAPSARREQVLAAAKNCVATISTYKYTDLAAYKKKGLACSTGQFSKDFAKAVDTLIKPQAPKLKAVSTAQISNGGLQSVEDGQWTVVVYGQVSVTNTSTPKGRVDPLAAVAQMEQRHGKWLIVKLDLLNSS